LTLKTRRSAQPAVDHRRRDRCAAPCDDDQWRLSRFFAAVTLSNRLRGIGTTASMHCLGMSSAQLCGMVAFLLNYVPCAGSATTLALLTVVAAST
jgi:predicted PurR-regulated permease PerM